MDMDELHVQEKNKKLEVMRANLKSSLENLYSIARYSEEPRNYSGSDLWRFFHDRLPSYLIEGAQNNLLVLSDGYFDFESNAITTQMASMGTTTVFLNKLRNRANWRSIMDEQELGIYPTGRSFQKINTCMAGIRPKYQDLAEIDMLIYTWQKWLNQMGISGASFVNFESTANAGKKVREWLN